jgi:hypothetical protein
MLLSSTLTVALAGKFDHPVLTPQTNASFARARQPRYWCCPRPRAFPGATVPKKKTSAHRTPWTKEDVRPDANRIDCDGQSAFHAGSNWMIRSQLFAGWATSTSLRRTVGARCGDRNLRR